MAKINLLNVTIDDDAVLAAIDEKVFNSTDVSLDPAEYNVTNISLGTNTQTGEKHLVVEVRPKPAT